MGEQSNILVIDDDPEMLDTVEFLLCEAGYNVTGAQSGEQAIAAFDGRDFDLAIVDLRLPDTDGLTLTRNFKEKSDIGIIILSGEGKATDRVIGLEVGADDYLAKPFYPRELLARVRSVLRRADHHTEVSDPQTQIYTFEGWKMNVPGMELTSPGGQVVQLTTGEFVLLRAFIENPNMVLSREQLLDHTHQNYTPAFDRSVDVQLGRLRKKIEDNPGSPQFLKTVRGAGYVFAAAVTRSA